MLNVRVILCFGTVSPVHPSFSTHTSVEGWAFTEGGHLFVFDIVTKLHLWPTSLRLIKHTWMHIRIVLFYAIQKHKFSCSTFRYICAAAEFWLHHRLCMWFVGKLYVIVVSHLLVSSVSNRICFLSTLSPHYTQIGCVCLCYHVSLPPPYKVCSCHFLSNRLNTHGLLSLCVHVCERERKTVG